MYLLKITVNINSIVLLDILSLKKIITFATTFVLLSSVSVGSKAYNMFCLPVVCPSKITVEITIAADRLSFGYNICEIYYNS